MARWKLPDTVNVEHVLMEPMVMGHSRSPYPFSTPPTVKHFASVVSPVTQRFLFPTKLCCLGSSRSARSDLGRLDTEEAGRVPSVGLGAGQERSDVRAVVLGTFLWFSRKHARSSCQVPRTHGNAPPQILGSGLVPVMPWFPHKYTGYGHLLSMAVGRTKVTHGRQPARCGSSTQKLLFCQREEK